jgi:hypothetical protein
VRDGRRNEWRGVRLKFWPVYVPQAFVSSHDLAPPTAGSFSSYAASEPRLMPATSLHPQAQHHRQGPDSGPTSPVQFALSRILAILPTYSAVSFSSRLICASICIFRRAAGESNWDRERDGRDGAGRGASLGHARHGSGRFPSSSGSLAPLGALLLLERLNGSTRLSASRAAREGAMSGRTTSLPGHPLSSGVRWPICTL